MNEKELIGRRIQELRNYLSRIECGKENLTLDMLIKLADILEIEIWEMFDFKHVSSRKELKEDLQDFARIADEPTLRLALKIVKTIAR